jgi:hypothetical protein
MTEILGSFRLEERTPSGRDGVAIGNVEEPCSGAAGGRLEPVRVGGDAIVGPGGAASTPGSARGPVRADATSSAL